LSVEWFAKDSRRMDSGVRVGSDGLDGGLESKVWMRCKESFSARGEAMEFISGLQNLLI
jgi:hypothetical protein